jgi:hypothetical protein
VSNPNAPYRSVYLLSRFISWLTMPAFTVGIVSTILLEKKIGLTTSFEDILILIGFGAFAVVGSLLIIRRPENSISWIMALNGLIVGVFPPLELYAAYVMTTTGRPNALAVFGAWANDIYWIPLLILTLIYLPLLFPNGKLLSRRWLPVAVLPGITIIGDVVISALRETLEGQNVNYQIANPIGIAGSPSLEEHPLFGIFSLGLAFGLLGAVASLAMRYRRSKGIERQQLKWFLYAAAFGPVAVFGELISLTTLIQELLFGLVLVGLPTAVATAILRYRLYDIDVIIRKTLVYAVLTGMLALVYFGMVVLLQSVFESVSGQQAPIVIVISTLVIAALFAPLRQWVQAVIDRRFFRRKYDAQQVLAHFAQTARDEVSLETLTAELNRVVQETMQPERVELWLKR